MDRDTLKKVLESIIFYSKKPVSVRKISANLDDVEPGEIREALDEVEKHFNSDHGINLQKVAGGYMFFTDPDNADYVKEIETRQKNVKLSNPALETLAIIAFKQPVTRAEVEEIRGVGCSAVINGLIEKGLLTVKGRSDELGAPLLYGTTRNFLEYFGLNSIRDLPKPDEL